MSATGTPAPGKTNGPPPIIAGKRKREEEEPSSSGRALQAGVSWKARAGGPAPIKAAPKRSGGAGGDAKAAKPNSTDGQPPAKRIPPAERRQKQAKPRQVFIYGNYDRYYGYRNPEGDRRKDPRVDCFKPEWFRGKRVLDIGCNVGVVTLGIARKFLPNAILGIDIDEALIKDAQKTLDRKKEKRLKYEAKLEQRSKRTTFDESGEPQTTTDGTATQPKPERAIYPFNVAYRTENFVEDKLTHDEKYDAILCLSVTKWIHLNWGDEGVKKLFRKIYDMLNDGGVLILEPQHWSTYRRKARLTPEHKQTMQAIAFRPTQFHEYLLNEVGFKSFEVLREGEADKPKKSKQKKEVQKDQAQINPDEQQERKDDASATQDKNTEDEKEKGMEVESKAEAEGTAQKEDGSKEVENKAEAETSAPNATAPAKKTSNFDRGIILYRK